MYKSQSSDRTKLFKKKKKKTLNALNAPCTLQHIRYQLFDDAVMKGSWSGNIYKVPDKSLQD